MKVKVVIQVLVYFRLMSSGNPMDGKLKVCAVDIRALQLLSQQTEHMTVAN